MNTSAARKLADALSTYTKGARRTSDGTYILGSGDPDPTCTLAAAMLHAQAAEIERLTAERDDALKAFEAEHALRQAWHIECQRLEGAIAMLQHDYRAMMMRMSGPKEGA